MYINRGDESGSVDNGQYLRNVETFCYSAPKNYWEQSQSVEAEITDGK